MNKQLEFLEYTVIEFSERMSLIAEVQKRLQEGWRLEGGIAIAVDPGSKFPMAYAQAMTRFVKAETSKQRVCECQHPFEQGGDPRCPVHGGVVESMHELPFELLPVLE